MNTLELATLRKYLRRQIAEKNNQYNGITKGFVIEGRMMRSDIVRQFSRGCNEAYRIADKLSTCSKDLSAYNFYDLDTLIAYNAFMGRVILEAENNRRRRNSRYFVSGDLNKAINLDTPAYFLANAGSEATGYYNPKHSVTVLTDEKNKLMYERTPDKRAFENKYNMYELEKCLSRYIEERHPKKQIVIDNPIDEDECTQEDLFSVENIGGRNYFITKEQSYCNEHFVPIRYVEGHTKDGRFAIRGFVDCEGIEWCGDVYDFDGNIVVDREQSGIDLYVDGVQQDNTRRR